jgi:hypothetical protein
MRNRIRSYCDDKHKAHPGRLESSATTQSNPYGCGKPGTTWRSAGPPLTTNASQRVLRSIRVQGGCVI